MDVTNQARVLLEWLFGAAGVALILGCCVLIVAYQIEKRRGQ